MSSLRIWRSAPYSLVALLGTLAAWLWIESRSSFEAAYFQNYAADLGHIRIYLLLAVGLCGAGLIFEDRLRHWLAGQARIQIALILAAIVAAIAVMLLLDRDQPYRLFRFPLGLWLTIAHGIGLSAIIVAFVLSLRSDLPLRRLSMILLPLLTALLLLSHFASLGEFMQLDLPDEPWLTSTATNYALHDALSPTYIASVFGTPDPGMPRYFLAMGVWLKLLGSTGIAALRSFPLLVAALAFGLTAAMLVQQKSLSPVQRAAGIVALLSQSAFVRTAHNLRSDIALAVYGALLLWTLLLLLDSATHRRRWAALMGLSLYIGLEAIPTVALLMSGSIGLILIVRSLRQGRQHLVYVVIYAAAAALACSVFVLVRLAPDAETAINNYSSFMQIYGDVTGSGQLRNPIPVMQNYHLRFSLALSPVEVIMMVLAAMALLRSPRPADRWILSGFGLAALSMLILAPASYGYWAAFAPFWAYAIARAASRKFVLLVMIPALAAAPVFDLTRSTLEGQNRQRLAEAASISDRFEPGSTILGEPLFWFTLHADHTYYGWTSMSRYRRRFGGSFEEILQALNPDAIICWIDFDGICEQIDGLGWFTPPEAVEVASQTYLIFHRLPADDSS